ncbi:hypothetical protein CDAR_465971, partial [Caerostris darwini]
FGPQWCSNSCEERSITKFNWINFPVVALARFCVRVHPEEEDKRTILTCEII